MRFRWKPASCQFSGRVASRRKRQLLQRGRLSQSRMRPDYMLVTDLKNTQLALF